MIGRSQDFQWEELAGANAVSDFESITFQGDYQIKQESHIDSINKLGEGVQLK